MKSNHVIRLYSKIRGDWKAFEFNYDFKCEAEDLFYHACRVMAEQIVTAAWVGSELKAVWNETGRPGDDITLLHNDPILDDFIVEERENQRQRAEESRYEFRSAS